MYEAKFLFCWATYCDHWMRPRKVSHWTTLNMFPMNSCWLYHHCRVRSGWGWEVWCSHVLQWQQMTRSSISQLHSAVILIDCDSCNGACRGHPVQPWPLSWINDNGSGPASGDLTVHVKQRDGKAMEILESIGRCQRCHIGWLFLPIVSTVRLSHYHPNSNHAFISWWHRWPSLCCAIFVSSRNERMIYTCGSVITISRTPLHNNSGSKSVSQNQQDYCYFLYHG